MTISGWILFGLLAAVVCVFGYYMYSASYKSKSGRILVLILTIVIIFAMFFGFRWYYTNTAAGQRAMIDQKSNITNGLERTVTVYTANGDIIAQYTGKIDIESNDGGYVLFDYNGKRYMYYNCFVESIADI